MNFISMDFETASFERHSAVSLGIVIVRDSKIVDELYTLIKPETTFNQKNIEINGINEEDVMDSPKFPQIWELIKNFYDETKLVVAHNASFDNSVLNKTLSYYGITKPNYLSLDTVKTTKKLYPDMENYKLDTVCKNMGIKLNNHHNALDDAEAAAKIIIKQSHIFDERILKESVKNI